MSGIFQQSAVEHVTQRERRSLWAFPRKPFVDTAVIGCRGTERREEGSGRVGAAEDLIALVSVSVWWVHLECTDRTF